MLNSNREMHALGYLFEAGKWQIEMWCW